MKFQQCSTCGAYIGNRYNGELYEKDRKCPSCEAGASLPRTVDEELPDVIASHGSLHIVYRHEAEAAS